MAVVRKSQAWERFYELAALETDECVVWPFSTFKTGYGCLRTPRPEAKSLRVHRIALELRTPCLDPSLDAAHSCHNRACMNYRHLRWASRSDNEADKLRSGTHNRGERHGNARLGETQVRHVRRMLDAGHSQAAMARFYRVSPSTISRIASRELWGWLDPQPKENTHALV